MAIKNLHIAVGAVSQALCQKMLGREHTLAHRLVFGAVVMVCGVCTAKAAGIVHIVGWMGHVVHVGLDLIGYAVHGLGALPFIEWLLGEGAAAEAAANADAIEAEAAAQFAQPSITLIDPFVNP